VSRSDRPGQPYVGWHNVNIDTGAEWLMFDRDLDGRFADASAFRLDGTAKNFANSKTRRRSQPSSPPTSLADIAATLRARPSRSNSAR